MFPHVERVSHALAGLLSSPDLISRPDLSCVDEMIRTEKGSELDVSQSARFRFRLRNLKRSKCGTPDTTHSFFWSVQATMDVIRRYELSFCEQVKISCMTAQKIASVVTFFLEPAPSSPSGFDCRLLRFFDILLVLKRRPLTLMSFEPFGALDGYQGNGVRSH